MEIEAKFSAPDAATLERLGELGELAGYQIAGGEVADMTDVYLDTAGHDLQAAGLVCRRRDRGDRVVLTVKRRSAPAGGADGEPGAIHRRDEWEIDLPADLAPDAPPSAWPPSEAREQVLAAGRDCLLTPLAEVRQNRVTRGLARDGHTIAELSLDTVTIVVADGARPAHHEVEAELKGDGTEADLATIADTLQREFALTPQPLSKFERAMAAAQSGSQSAGQDEPQSAAQDESQSAAQDEPSAVGLLSDDQAHLLTRIARRTDAVGRRARVLLALHDGALQRDAAARAGMAPRTVRYWLNRFRTEGLAIFPARLVAARRPVAAAPTASEATPSAPVVDVTATVASAPAAAPASAPATTQSAAATETDAERRAAKKLRNQVKRARKAAAAAAAGALHTPAATAPRAEESEDDAAGAAAAAPAAQAPATVEAPARPAATPAPRSARLPRPGIRATDTMAEAAFKTLRFHLDRMLEHEAGTRADDDIEDLHDMRVATRRMRAALRVFEPYLDAQALRPIERGLKRTGHMLGAVRDLDVFHEKTMRYLDSLPAERHGDLDPLLAVWVQRRLEARAALLAYLDGDRYPRFVESLTGLLDDPAAVSLAFVSESGEARPHRVAHVLPAVLYDRVASVWAYDDVVGGHDTPLVRFHRLRIAGKSLRYTFEFFEEVLGPQAKPLVSTTKEMQDHLGDLQDAVVTCTILRNFLTWGSWEPPSGNMRRAMTMIIAPGVATYLATRQGELNRLVDTFPEMWAKIRGADFSRRLGQVVGEL
jgi:CHAD domain-containing protein